MKLFKIRPLHFDSKSRSRQFLDDQARRRFGKCSDISLFRENAPIDFYMIRFRTERRHTDTGGGKDEEGLPGPIVLDTDSSDSVVVKEIENDVEDLIRQRQYEMLFGILRTRSLLE